MYFTYMVYLVTEQDCSIREQKIIIKLNNGGVSGWK